MDIAAHIRPAVAGSVKRQRMLCSSAQDFGCLQLELCMQAVLLYRVHGFGLLQIESILHFKSLMEAKHEHNNKHIL